MSGQLYQERDTRLHRLNPVAKLAGFSILMVVPALFLDPVTPATFLALALFLGWGLGGYNPFYALRRLAPFLWLAAGLVLFNTLLYGGPRAHLLLRAGPLLVWAEGLAVGASIGLRLLCFAAYSSLFVWTTDPTLLVASLIHQLRMPYRLGFATLAAYRFLPILQGELENIRAANQVRGAYEGPGLRDRLARVRRYGIPLLANGIRQAERLAVAMDARGFGALDARTSYIRPRSVAWDYFFVAMVFLLAIAVLLALARYGLLRGFLAGPAESLTGGR